MNFILITMIVCMLKLTTTVSKIRAYQFNITASAIIGAIRGSFRERLYQEFSLQTLQQDNGIENS